MGPAPALSPLTADTAARSADTRPIVFDGEQLEAAVHRGELPAGTRLSGPALCALAEATLLVPPGWSGEVDLHGSSSCIDSASRPEHA